MTQNLIMIRAIGSASIPPPKNLLKDIPFTRQEVKFGSKEIFSLYIGQLRSFGGSKLKSDEQNWSLGARELES